MLHKKAIPVYAILFVGNVGNPFPTNYLILYIRNGVMMGVSDVSYTFVGMWECGNVGMWEYKKVFLTYLYVL